MVPLLEVYDASTSKDHRVGTARFSLRRGTVSTTFSYDEGWLTATDAYALDPGLPLRPGPHHCVGLPGAFRDSSPDRWGRTLIERNRRDEAIQSGLPLRQLDDVDYLIGVFDRTREGSLRFCESGGAFLDESPGVPPIVQLPRLARASQDVAKHEAGRAEIKELLEAGSASLGGARPKASVCDDGRLLLAKFSHPEDDWDVMAWEKTALDLAAKVGIPVPPSRLVRVGDEAALLLDRFDREGSLLEGQRIPYMSAMTALQAQDGQTRDYAELAESLTLFAQPVAQQLKELFTRVSFSIAVGNTDDHLRNWGFLRNGGSWHLAPLFDVNPNAYLLAARATTVAGEPRDREAQGLRDLADYCGLTPEEAAKVVAAVLTSVSRWKTVARKNGCPERDQKLFEPVFTQKARELKTAFSL